jgi:hypothetical protein
MSFARNATLNCWRWRAQNESTFCILRRQNRKDLHL